MGTKITFNGITYSDPSEMPADVRQAYQQALGLLADRDGNGIPDLLEVAGQGNAISVQHRRIIVNGQTYDGPEEMPPAVRELYQKVLKEVGGGGLDPSNPIGGTRIQLGWGSAPAAPGEGKPSPHPAEPGLWLVFGLLTMAVIGAAIVIMLSMDAGSRPRAGRFYVAIGALVLLGFLDTQIERFVIRLAAPSLGTTSPERRYAAVSLPLWLLAAVVLLGAAWLLP